MNPFRVFSLIAKTSVAVVAFLSASSLAMAATQQTQTSIESSGNTQESVDWRISPALGTNVISGKASVNLGAAVSSRIFTEVPLYLEPSLVMGINSDLVQFHSDLGARYDISVPNTFVTPFVRFAVGPTFQTSGSAVVFNMFGGAGALIPLENNWTLRAEAGLFQVDGNAGFQVLGGVML